MLHKGVSTSSSWDLSLLVDLRPGLCLQGENPHVIESLVIHVHSSVQVQGQIFSVEHHPRPNSLGRASNAIWNWNFYFLNYHCFRRSGWR